MDKGIEVPECEATVHKKERTETPQKDTKEMFLEAYFPQTRPAEILDNMDFGVDIARAVELEPPSREELRILRERCDPDRLILG